MGRELPDEVGNKLLQAITTNNYDKIVTHNWYGEYGHSQHKSLSSICII